MEPHLMTAAFVAALCLSLAVRLWLLTRQMRHVAAHRGAVPTVFAARVSIQAHQRAADYTLAQGRLALVNSAVGTATVVAWTLLGGLDALNGWLREALLPGYGAFAYQLALLAAVSIIGGLIELPGQWYSTFRVEQRFGFNRTTARLWWADQAKGALVTAALVLPLAALVLWIMAASDGLWWLWAWLALLGFNLTVLVAYPTVIAPLFNTFKPLTDAALAGRVQALMRRCGFSAQGLFVMDGSRRSAHGNAYFTGIGTAKRVVFYDTLLDKLTPGEVEAVLAHELGHFKLRHVPLTLAGLSLASLALLALLGWLAVQSGFYAGLGVSPNLAAPNDALTLLLFVLVLPSFGFFVSPLTTLLSRRHEFQADAYACRQSDGRDLASALLKLHADNASTLTPDPLYARFFYSHPPASERLAALPRPDTLAWSKPA
jgi:STE24 endopeptidase